MEMPVSGVRGTATGRMGVLTGDLMRLGFCFDKEVKGAGEGLVKLKEGLGFGAGVANNAWLLRGVKCSSVGSVISETGMGSSLRV